MPNIRIMNWNVEKLSVNKTNIATMANAIGQIIADSNADIAIILEVVAGSWQASMTAVSAAASAASLAGGGNANDYIGWLTSYESGGEVYGVLIKNLNVVRPVVVAGGPAGRNTYADPALSNLDHNQFSTWPGTFAAMVNAYAAPLPGSALRQLLPLTDIYASALPAGRKRKYFAGQTLATGGYALGRGFRMPCLMMFHIQAAANILVPILTCHLGAVRGGANPLARGQISQYKDTNIAQKFQNPAALALPHGSYVDLDGAPQPVQDLIVTGDFNVDFLEQAPPGAAAALTTGNRAALNQLTPTSTGGLSAVPAAAPGAPGGVPMVIPFAAPAGGWPDAPITNTIPSLALKTAVTAVGTILNSYDAAAPAPANTLALRGACFDNFFFGGAALSAHYVALTAGPPITAGSVIDVPNQIVQGGAVGAGALGVGGIWAHNDAGRIAWVAGGSLPPGKIFRNCAAAPNLAPGAGAAALTTNDRLIGARFISDHLPSVVQFNLP